MCLTLVVVHHWLVLLIRFLFWLSWFATVLSWLGLEPRTRTLEHRQEYDRVFVNLVQQQTNKENKKHPAVNQAKKSSHKWAFHIVLLGVLGHELHVGCQHVQRRVLVVLDPRLDAFQVDRLLDDVVVVGQVAPGRQLYERIAQDPTVTAQITIEQN